MYLLDTNIVSVTAPTKAAATAGLAAWMVENNDSLYISVVTAAEIMNGVRKAERLQAFRKATLLRSWWASIEEAYAERLSPFDLRAAHVAGGMLDRARAFDAGFEDIAIAATAQVHGLTVLTANEVRFAPLGVPFLNPLKSLPAQP